MTNKFPWYAKINAAGDILLLLTGANPDDQQIGPGERWVGLSEKPGYAYVRETGASYCLKKINPETDELIAATRPEPRGDDGPSA